jgi:hypothetical protein
MATRLQLLTARRHALVARSQLLRLQLLRSSAELRRSVGLGQIAQSLTRPLRKHPLLVIGIVAAVLAAGPRRILRTGSLALGAWSTLGQLRRIATALAGRKSPD